MASLHRHCAEVRVHGFDLTSHRIGTTIRNMRLYWLHLLLIFSLLACPLNCMGALEFVDGAPQSQPAKCGCCHHNSASDSSPQSPHAPTEECPCPTCLCNGAVTAGDDALVQLDHEAGCSTTIFIVASDCDQLQQSCVPSLRELSQWQRTALPAGRIARIVNQSFLL